MTISQLRCNSKSTNKLVLLYSFVWFCLFLSVLTNDGHKLGTKVTAAPMMQLGNST